MGLVTQTTYIQLYVLFKNGLETNGETIVRNQNLGKKNMKVETRNSNLFQNSLI